MSNPFPDPTKVEWKILKDTPVLVQKKLNQWKHNYHLTIHGVTHDNNSSVVVILTRTKKE